MKVQNQNNSQASFGIKLGPNVERIIKNNVRVITAKDRKVLARLLKREDGLVAEASIGKKYSGNRTVHAYDTSRDEPTFVNVSCKVKITKDGIVVKDSTDTYYNGAIQNVHGHEIEPDYLAVEPTLLSQFISIIKDLDLPKLNKVFTQKKATMAAAKKAKLVAEAAARAKADKAALSAKKAKKADEKFLSGIGIKKEQ